MVVIQQPLLRYIKIVMVRVQYWSRECNIGSDLVKFKKLTPVKVEI